MTLDIALVFLITAVTFVLFLTERLRTDVLALTVLCSLALLKLLKPEEMLACFSNPAPITVAAMFVLGAGLTRTGALEGIGKLLLKLADKGELVLLLVMMVLVTAISTFINNTAVVSFFMPVVLYVCAQKQLMPSRFLIPLSFSAMFGGTCSLIGTSTNIVVNNVILHQGLPAIGMFEPTRMGLLYAAAGIAYMLIWGRRYLPARDTLTTLMPAGGSRQFRTDLVVLENAALIGRKLGEVRLAQLRAGTILGVTRAGVPVDPPFDRIELQAGDRIIVTVPMSGLDELRTARGLAVLPEADPGLGHLGGVETAMVEAIVPMDSSLRDKTLRTLDFAHRHGVRTLALHRHGMNMREQLEDLPLKFGDSLLLHGTEVAVESLRGDRSLLLLSPVKIPASRRHKRWLAIAIVAGVVLADAFGLMSVTTAALFGSVLLVLTGCLNMTEGYEAINWNIIMLIAGSLGLGLAMEHSGGAQFIAEKVYSLCGSFGPHVALSGTYLIAMVLTELIANTAVAALMVPIAISSAHVMQCDPRPFIFAVMFAGSASFATPIGYQTNTMIYGAGGYKFTDFFKIGAPLNLLLWILASVMIPVFWPLR